MFVLLKREINGDFDGVSHTARKRRTECSVLTFSSVLNKKTNSYFRLLDLVSDL